MSQTAHVPDAYGASAALYLTVGWPCVIPVPPQSKTPPPAGYTGEHGRDTAPADVQAMRGAFGSWSVALRMPDGVIGIDVDDYAKGQTQKRGAATLAHFEALWGPLPPTWSSTARGLPAGESDFRTGQAGPSRIMFFRCPPGRYRSMLGPDVEIIQRHHRYAVVAPSWHHDVAAPYRWYDPMGRAWDMASGTWVDFGDFPAPGPSALGQLPPAWCEGLREGAAPAGAVPADPGAGWAMLAAIRDADDTEPCAEVYSASLKAREVLAKADPGSRHDQTVGRVHQLVMLGAKGHPGVSVALAELAQLWETLTAGEGRTEEFERMLLTSARKAVTEVGRTEPVPGDPCLLMWQGQPAVGQQYSGGDHPSQVDPVLQPNGVPGLSHVPNGAGAGPAGAGMVPGGAPLPTPPVFATVAPQLYPVGHASPSQPGPYLNGAASDTAPLPPPGAGHQLAGPAPLAPPPIPPDPGGGVQHVIQHTPGAQHVNQHTHEDPHAPEPGQPFNLIQAIGVGPFDPPALLDQPLADAVLARMAPVLRYAIDARQWLVLEGDRWDARTDDMAGWATGMLARFAPAGDPKADKGTPEHTRAARRTRLLSTAGRNAIASAARDVVRGGWHPASVKLAQLDTEPETLWAGGLPWDLGRSQDRPVLAELDPRTVHLHSAGYAPAPVPTPMWDAFLAAVWPDPQIRSWALRVLSVSLTGYSDATMPVMVGLHDMGKTAVVQLILDVLGTYGIAANAKLLSPNDSSHDTIVYALKGARLAFIDEGPRNGALATERLKQITGGGRMTGREVGQGEVRFEPTHTLVLTANEEPTLTDAAIRKRARLIPCEGDVDQIRAARRAIGYVGRPGWQAEAPGVLHQLMVEAARWLDDRDSALTEAAPLSIRHRAEEVAAEQDPVRCWVEEETEPYEQGTPAGQLYRAFVSWWRDTGRPGAPVSTQKWGRELTRLGHDRLPLTRVGQGVTRMRPLRLRGSGPGGGWGFSPPPVPTNPDNTDTPRSTDVLPNPAQPAVSPVSVTDPGGTVSVTAVTDIGNTASGLDQSGAATDLVTDLSVAVTDVGAVSVTQGNRSSSSVLESVVTDVTNKDSIGEVETHTATYTGDRGPVSVTSVIGYNMSQAQLPLEEAEPAAPEPPPAHPVKATRARLSDAEKAERAAQRRAQKAAAKLAARQQAIELAGGGLVELPALVTRPDGAVSAVSLDQAGAVVSAQTEQWGTLTIDVENTGYPVGHPAYALRTIQLGSPAVVAVLDADDPAQCQLAAELVAAAPRLSAHSAPADLVPLVHAGLATRDSVWARMWDSVIPLKLADPALTGSDPSLKAAAPAVLGPAALSPAADDARAALFKAGGWLTDVEPETPPERSGWAQVDKRCVTMIRYAGSDVLDCAAVGFRSPQPSAALWERERTAQRAVARISHDGLRLDAARVAQLSAEHTDRCAELAPAIARFGISNPGSSLQVATALTQLGAGLPPTKGGRPSAAKGVLEPLRGSEGLVGELADAVLDWRHADTALKLFLRPWQQMIDYDPANPRIRSTIYTLSADTGRMSSVRFNLQQLSRTGGIRSCVTADEGHALISADFSGVEVRVMAALSQDPVLMRLLTDGPSLCPERAAGRAHDDQRCGWCKGDLHRIIAAQVYGPGWTKGNRYNVKQGVFGWAYGSNAANGNLAAQIGVTQGEAEAIVATLAGVAPTYVDWAEQAKQGVRRGVTDFPAYSGRVIHLDRRQPHKAPNYEIQGTARELLVDALIRWHAGPWGGAITVPVHDEILAMVPADEAAQALDYLTRCMRTTLYGVPIEVEASDPSPFWADAS